MKDIVNFIIETLLPYKEDPELCGVDKDDRCQYLTKDGNKCAVGRWLKDGEWQFFDGTADELFKLYGIDILVDDVKDMGISGIQWDNIQRYHDNISTGIYDHFPIIMNNIVNNIEDDFELDRGSLNILRFEI